MFENQLLILQDHHSNHGDLPGGRMAESELYSSWTDVLGREISEELGNDFTYRIHPEPIFVFPHFVEKDSMPAVGIAYYGIARNQSIRLSDEHTAFDWAEAKLPFQSQISFVSTMADALDRFLQAFKKEQYASIHQNLISSNI